MNKAQHANAGVIMREVCARARREGWPYQRAYQVALITMMVAMTEANLSMYASANVPESQKYPHQPVLWTSDGLGHDHASMNMFQQQTGYHWTPAGYGPNMNQTTMNSPNGWGTPEELMNPAIATRKFLTALGQHYYRGVPADTYIPHAYTLGERAQLVQGSAFPSRYQAQFGAARRFLLGFRRFRRAWAASAPKKKAKR